MVLTSRLLRGLSISPRLFQYKFWTLPTKPILIPATVFKLKRFSRHYCEKSCYEDRDPAVFFFNDKVQEILKSLTDLNIEKVFKNRHLENQDPEEYKFLSKEELQERIDESLKDAKILLQMPPVVQERKPITEVLSFDPALQGRDTTSLVVTDISFGVSDRKRIIVVREANGLLRQATWEERDRLNQVYNPRPGRYLTTPQIFEDQNLKEALKREEYTFVLDFACSHFEPDHPLFYQVTRDTYEHINKREKYEDLHSTRHYGPMCFYFAWNKIIDDLLIYYIQKERLSESAKLISLYYLIHDETKVESEEMKGESLVNYIEKYIEQADSAKRIQVKMALQSYKETVREREEAANTIKASHGIA